jgi:hypothetical protein
MAIAIAVVALIISGLSLYVAYLSYQRSGKRDDRDARQQAPIVVTKVIGGTDLEQPLALREVAVSIENVGSAVALDVTWGVKYGDWWGAVGETLVALQPGEPVNVQTVVLPSEVEQQLLEADGQKQRWRTPLAVEDHVEHWRSFKDVHGEIHGDRPPKSTVV